MVSTSLRCFVCRYLVTFLAKKRSSFEESLDTRIRSKSWFSLALWCFVFQHLVFFSLKNKFSIELFCGPRIRGRFFLEKYTLSFCYVDLLAFSIEIYRPLTIYTMILGDMSGALVLCFPTSGETCTFSCGCFPSKWCSFSLVLLWRFVCRLLALFFFGPVGCLCGRLGLP